MITEQLLKRLEDIEAGLSLLDPAWREKIAHGHGAAGTMTAPATPAIEGYVTPKGVFANLRTSPSTVGDNIAFQLTAGGVRKVVGRIADYNGAPYIWYITDDEKYAREDVVNFSQTEPTARVTVISPMPVFIPAVPVNMAWARWDAPIDGYTTTNTHLKHNHTGIDLAGQIGTPVRCGPHGGYVVKVFECKVCGTIPESQTRMGTTDPNTGFGLGNYVIVRYSPLFLPATVKAAIGDKFLYVLYAHLSKITVYTEQTLEPFQEIGKLGTSGNSTGPHVHIQCRYSESNTAEFHRLGKNEIDPDLLFQL